MKQPSLNDRTQHDNKHQLHLFDLLAQFTIFEVSKEIFQRSRLRKTAGHNNQSSHISRLMCSAYFIMNSP
jgi:hypothetical protein